MCVGVRRIFVRGPFLRAQFLRGLSSWLGKNRRIALFDSLSAAFAAAQAITNNCDYSNLTTWPYRFRCCFRSDFGPIIRLIGIEQKIADQLCVMFMCSMMKKELHRLTKWLIDSCVCAWRFECFWPRNCWNYAAYGCPKMSLNANQWWFRRTTRKTLNHLYFWLCQKISFI